MSVHGRLRLLVTEHGDRVLHASDDLRGVLDDYFAEGELSVGELNLLVDAVRMHAFERLEALLQQGADPRTAVEASGLALAQERSGDVRSAAWAVAALGYAVGKVPEGLVLAYEDQPPPTQPPPPRPPPTQPPPPQQPPHYRPAQAPTQPPPYPRSPGPAGPFAGAAARPTWEQPHPPPSGSRTGLLLAGGALLVLLVLLVVAIVLNTGDDPDTRQAGSDTASSEPTTSSEATPSDSVETTTPRRPEREPGTPVKLDDLSSQFASLGSTVAADATGCEVIRPVPGTTQRVRCRYQHLRVIYATYVDDEAFDAARAQQRDRSRADGTDYRESNVSSDAAFILGTGGGRTWLYWDARNDLTSGFLESPTPQLSDRAAENWFDQRGEAEASRVLPAAVPPFESDALWELATYYVGDQVRGGRVRDCVSNPNPNAPFVQEQRVQCVDGDFEVTFTSVAGGDLQPARDHFAESADVNSTWDWVANEDLTYPTAGAYMLTYGDAGRPLVYFDDSAQGVFGFVTNPESGHDRAVAYFGSGDATASR